MGQKSGAGYYRYDPKTRARESDPEVVVVVEAQAAQQGVTRRTLSDQEILDRHLLALVNEGFRILEEGVALAACTAADRGDAVGERGGASVKTGMMQR